MMTSIASVPYLFTLHSLRNVVLMGRTPIRQRSQPRNARVHLSSAFLTGARALQQSPPRIQPLRSAREPREGLGKIVPASLLQKHVSAFPPMTFVNYSRFSIEILFRPFLLLRKNYLPLFFCYRSHGSVVFLVDCLLYSTQSGNGPFQIPLLKGCTIVLTLPNPSGFPHSRRDLDCGGIWKQSILVDFPFPLPPLLPSRDNSIFSSFAKNRSFHPFSLNTFETPCQNDSVKLRSAASIPIGFLHRQL